LQGVHYEGVKGKLIFGHGETEKRVMVPIMKPKNEEDDEDSANMFGFQLSNITPLGAKLSKKSFMHITIVADLDKKK
jgi:hypothetical protein